MGRKIKAAENEAIARGIGLPISAKMAMEICGFIRGKDLDKMISYLENISKFKTAIPIKKFNWDLTHKPGYGPARYPIKTAESIIQLLKLAKANAENKGLNSANLKISFAKADFGPQRWHNGRQGRTKMKNTHVEIHVLEIAKEDKSWDKAKKIEKAKQSDENDKNKEKKL